MARGNKGESQLDKIAEGLALELASYTTRRSAPDSTLRLARDFMLSPIYDLEKDKDELPEGGPIWVTRRDSRGVAMPLLRTAPCPPFSRPTGDADGNPIPAIDSSGKFKGGAPPPYKVLGEKGVDRDDDERALNSDQPCIETSTPTSR